MIIFLHGPDTYRSNKKLKEIIARYKEIHTSGMSFHALHADLDSFDNFRNTAGSVSMFGEKKLVVLTDFTSSKEFTARFMSWQGKDALVKNEDTVCVFKEEHEDKKNPLFVWFLENANAQEFAVLLGAQLYKWAKQFVEKAGIEIEQSALGRLLTYTGGDLWAFENEIRKLKLYTRGVISDRALDIFMRPLEGIGIFSLVDAYIERNRARAARLLHGHLAAGDNANYLFSMIHNQFRNVAQAQWFLEKGELDVSRIARLCKMHPYVAKKSMTQARAFDKARIKKIYSQLVDLDQGMKTGKMDGRAALESFIFAG